jgi:oligopeptide transport system substrate-binding protein
MNFPCIPGRWCALLALAIALCACGNGNGDGSTLKVAAVAGSAPRLVAASTRLGLTMLDGSGQVVPGLARSWRVADDGRSIVFRLRTAQYANGAPVQTADVVAAIQRARRDRSHPFAGLLDGISAVGAPLADVIELRLTTPQAELLELLAQPEMAVLQQTRKPPALGPFVAHGDGNSGGAAVRLARNDRFHGAADVPLAMISVQPTSEAAAVQQFTATATDPATRGSDPVPGGSDLVLGGSDLVLGGSDLVLGGSDLVLGGTWRGLAAARGAGSALRIMPSRSVLLLLVNTRTPALADARVRQALSMAIDRTGLATALFGDAPAPPVWGAMPPGLPGLPDPYVPPWNSAPLVARQETARALLAMAGHGADAPLRVEIAHGASAADAMLVARLAADWAAIGITVGISSHSDTALARDVARGRFQLAIAERGAAFASPLPFLLPLRCGATPGGGCLADADRLLRQSWQAVTPADRMALLAEAERRWAAAGLVIGLASPPGWALIGPRVAGWPDRVDNGGAVPPLSRLDMLPERRLFK